jgi:hypothetical protein
LFILADDGSRTTDRKLPDSVDLVRSGLCTNEPNLCSIGCTRPPPQHFLIAAGPSSSSSFHRIAITIMAVVSTTINNAVSHTTNMGPELRGGNITLERIFHKSDVSSRQTKIICTMGPACWDVPTLEQLIDAGLSMARFNFSHGDHAAHAACLERVRTAATNKNKHVGTFAAFGE